MSRITVAEEIVGVVVVDLPVPAEVETEAPAKPSGKAARSDDQKETTP